MVAIYEIMREKKPLILKWYPIQKSGQEWSPKVFFATASWIKLLLKRWRSLFAGTLHKILSPTRPFFVPAKKDRGENRNQMRQQKRPYGGMDSLNLKSATRIFE